MQQPIVQLLPTRWPRWQGQITIAKAMSFCPDVLGPGMSGRTGCPDYSILLRNRHGTFAAWVNWGKSPFD